MLNFIVMQYKKRFLLQNIYCNISNLSEFNQDYESASHILFYKSWILTNITIYNFNNQLLLSTHFFYSKYIGLKSKV